jgi:hypothetical protein
MMNLAQGITRGRCAAGQGAWRRGEYQQQAEATEHHAADTDLQQGDDLETHQPMYSGQSGKTCEQASQQTDDSSQGSQRAQGVGHGDLLRRRFLSA